MQENGGQSATLGLGRVLALVAVLAFGLGWATVRRNRDYRTRLGLYNDTIAKLPDNAYAQTNIGVILVDRGEAAEAIRAILKRRRCGSTSEIARDAQ